MRRAHLLVLLSGIWLMGSCTTARYVRPVEKGKTVATAAFGGPMIVFSGLSIPTPLLTASVAHGYKDDLTGFGSLHLTSAAFGVFHVSGGVTKGLRKPDGWVPGVSVSPIANFMFDKWEGHFNFFPQLDANAYWSYGKRKNYCYVGIGNWFDLHTTRADGQPQTNHWLPMVQVGNVFARNKWEYTLELKYIAPGTSNKNLVATYVSPASTGALGFYFGVTRKF